MEKSVWLKITAKKKYSRWEIGQVTAFTKAKPTCKANEIAVKLTLSIPDNLFDEPAYEFKATLPATPRKHVEAAELSKGVAEALSLRMGMKVKVTMEEKTKDFGDELRGL
jgi:hypothetical protein